MSPATPRRERILQAAERLFRHYGPAKTTMADIARACGVGVGSLYLDFSSKDAIVDELGSARVRRVAERMREASAPARGPRERLAAMLEARLRALFEVADEGRHACDLVRCRAVSAALDAEGEEPAPAETPYSVHLGFGPEERELLLDALTELCAEANGAAAEPAEALALLELAFSALTPPQLYRLDRQRALALGAKLAHAVVYGLAAAGTSPEASRRAGARARR